VIRHGSGDRQKATEQYIRTVIAAIPLRVSHDGAHDNREQQRATVQEQVSSGSAG
jgi:hypothetical protein